MALYRLKMWASKRKKLRTVKLASDNKFSIKNEWTVEQASSSTTTG